MADERTSGRLTPEQTLRLHAAMRTRMTELGLMSRHLYPVSKSTYYKMDTGTLALNLSTLPDVDTAMWWEPGSAADYALGRGPLRPKPRPTPFQWLIFDLRSRKKLTFEAVAGQSGSDDKGPLLTSGNVHRLEREAPKRHPGDRTIRGLANGLGVDEAAIHDALARTVIGEQTDDSHLETELRRILAKVDTLDEQGRADWVATADLLADALLRASARVVPEPPKPHLDQTLYELGQALDADEISEAFRKVDEAGSDPDDPDSSD